MLIALVGQKNMMSFFGNNLKNTDLMTFPHHTDINSKPYKTLLFRLVCGYKSVFTYILKLLF